MIAAATGEPLAKARVRFSTDSAAISDAVFTDVNGVFTFSGLPAGRYTLSAEKAGYASLRYGSKSPFDPPAEITVAGNVVDRISVALLKGAAVVGRISDDQGDPIVGGVVSLSAVQLLGSELHLVAVPRGTTETNDLGEYRIGDLPAGRYFVNVEGAGLGTMPSGMPREWERLKAWGPTFFPGSGGLANATPLAIVAGEERTGVDFAVVASSQSMLFVSVTGGAFDPNAETPAANMRRLADAAAGSPPGSRIALAGAGQPGGPSPPVTINFVPGDTTLGAAMEGNTQVRVGGLGSYGMPIPGRLGPGNWLAVARQDRSGAILQFTVSQGDSNVPLNIVLAPQSRVSGRVVFEGTSRAPSPASVKVDVHGAGSDAAIQPRVLTSGPVTPKADGTFDINDVMGTIVLEANAPPGWTLKALRYDGRDLLDDPLALKPGVDVAGVEVVLSDQVATLSGAATNSNGQPVSGCTVAVFPAATAEGARDTGNNAELRFNSRRMRLVRADQTGSFRVADLPSGSYFVAAATDIDASVWLTPEFLDRLRAGATPVTLGDREQKVLPLSCEGAR